MGGNFKVARVDGGERDEFPLKLPAAVTLEGRFAGEGQVSQLDQSREPVVQDIALCGPDVARTFLVIPPGDTEEGVENRHETLSIDCEEGQLVDPFGLAPRKTEDNLVGGAENLSQVTDGEISGGTQGATDGLEGLIISHPRLPLLHQSGKYGRGGASIVQDMNKG